MSMSPKDIHEIEQGAQAIKDQLVPVLASFFEAVKKSGFTRDEAYQLTRDYMAGILFQQPGGPSEKD